jgi:hypothetical protein
MAMCSGAKAWLRWGIFSGLATLLFWCWWWLTYGSVPSVVTPALNWTFGGIDFAQLPSSLQLPRWIADPIIVSLLLVPFMLFYIWDDEDHRGNNFTTNIGTSIGLVVAFILGLIQFFLEIALVLLVAIAALFCVVGLCIFICEGVQMAWDQIVVKGIRFLNASNTESSS